VREGDIPPASACEDRYRIQPDNIARGADAEGSRADLPPGLLRLSDRAERLYDRVRHLDKRMYMESKTAEPANPVLSHMDRLKSAFGI
jgi:regulator of CtrA degradation